MRERRDTLLVKRDTATYLPAARLLERALKPTRETSMKTAIAVATAVVLFASISGASAQNLPGKYNVEGKNLDGSAYSGTAEIIATSETTCRIRWKRAAQRRKASGCVTATASWRVMSWAIQSASSSTK